MRQRQGNSVAPGLPAREDVCWRAIEVEKDFAVGASWEGTVRVLGIYLVDIGVSGIRFFGG